MLLAGRDGTERLVECGGAYYFTLARSGDDWRATGVIDEIVWRRGF